MTAKSTVTKNTFADPDDAPELTDSWFKKADLMHSAKLVRRGASGRTNQGFANHSF